MTRETTSSITPPTLVEACVQRAGLSWAQAAGVAAVALTVFFAAAAYLDGLLAGPFDADLWRNAMLYPAITAYTLLMQPWLKRLFDLALEAFRPFVPVDDDDFRRLLARAPVFDRRNQGLAFALGASVVLLFRPWSYYPFWLTLYSLLGALMYGLLGWFIYVTASASMIGADWDFSMDVNVFELKLLEPVARWGLGVALSYVGGITLSLLFLPRLTLLVETLILYGLLTATPVLVFFASMLSTHRLMAEAKRRELDTVRNSLAAASRALKQRSAEGRTDEMQELFELIAGWAAYEKQIEALPEWPYTADIRRSLLVSSLLPAVAWLARSVLLEALLRMLPSR